VQEWRKNQAGDLIKRYGNDPELMVEDTRTPGQPRFYPFNGIQREIYDLCDEIQSGSGIAEFARARGAAPASVPPFLDRLVSERLMLREGNQYLSLAVNCDRRRAPAGAAEAATF
jgi:hypothetical protein